MLEEFAFIHRYLKPLAADDAALTLTDDAALIQLPPGQLGVFTTDTLVEGVHFFGFEPPQSIAQKLLRVNLSDLAAMGAAPLYYFLNLSLPPSCSEEWAAGFCEGLEEDQRHFSIRLAGGDTTSTTGPLVLSASALGAVPAGQALIRSGACSGEDIWVSGTLGDAALGLMRLRQEGAQGCAQPNPPVTRYLRPLPRLALGIGLRGIASACMDISDGLAQDAGHIAQASGVCLEMDARRIPLSPPVLQACAAGEISLETCMSGGDDYELLFTAPAASRQAVLEAAAASSVEVHRIGNVSEGKGVLLRGPDGNPLKLAQGGWRHFQSGR